MALKKLLLTPSRTSYAATAADDVHYVKMDGGPPKIRLDQVGGTASVAVRWVLTDDEYTYFMAFWRVLGSGAERFLLDLVLDGPEVAEYEVNFKEGSPRLVGEAPGAHEVEADLDVSPLEHDPDYDAVLVELYGAPGLLDQLEQLVNVDFDLPALNP